MKKLVLLLVFLPLALVSKAQNGYSAQQVMQMLKEFYSTYHTIFNSGFEQTVLAAKLDSLRKIYYTETFYKEQRLAINNKLLISGNRNVYIDSLNKTLNVVQDPTATNQFIVSYISHIPQLGVTVDQKVFLQVTVTKETTGYRIASASKM